MERWNYIELLVALYIYNTNSIPIMGFTFKVLVNLEGLLELINSLKNLAAED